MRSPERFCLLTQALADLFHRRHPGIGVHIYVFVDDYLVVGDDEAATRRGCMLPPRIMPCLYHALLLY